MTSRTFKVMVLAAALLGVALSTSSCNKASAILRASGERWVLVGEKYLLGRDSGSPREDWVATLQVPDGELTRLIRMPMTKPDGDRARFPWVTYNEAGKILIFVEDDFHGEEIYDDVWRYDLATGRSRWIARGRWDNTRGFAWSPDGSKVAFVASMRGQPAAFVVQYDVQADKLEEVAGDAFGNLNGNSWQEGNSSWRPRRPVYSEDGNWLYYISTDQHVMRVDLRTRRCEQLPFTNGFDVLTVRGEHLVYAREAVKGKGLQFQIVKVRLDAADDSHGQQVYPAAGILNWNFVSPSRRFILFMVRNGYACDVQLLDVESGTTCGAWDLWKQMEARGFFPHSTAVAGSAGP